VGYRLKRITLRVLGPVPGILLLAPAGILTKTFFGVFARTAVHSEQWMGGDFWAFCMGCVLWMLAFVVSLWATGEPCLLGVYVYGHEMTHAFWSMLMGGRVTEFKASREGGYVVTDKHNLWVALAPYFHPMLSMVVVGVFGLAGVFVDVTQWTWVLFISVGATWAFHLSFTGWMISKGQSDLRMNGTFYSLLIIYLMNMLLLSLMFFFFAPVGTAKEFGLELLDNAESFGAWSWARGRELWGWGCAWMRV